MSAQVPSLLEYDGYMTGNITGNRTIGVKLYSASTNGTLLYSENIGTVKVTNGEFYFQYGTNGTAGNSTTSIAATLTGTQQWLALTVNGTEQTPRERLVAVPFALKSADGQKVIQDLSMVTQAVGRTINALGGNYSAVSGNLSSAVATLESKATQFQSLQNEGRVIGVSGNISFGSVALQSNSTRSLTITNSGYAKLNVSRITHPSGFSGTWSGVIASGGSQAVTVKFLPTQVKAYSGNIIITSDATSGSGVISVSGSGVNYPTPTHTLIGFALSSNSVVVGSAAPTIRVPSSVSAGVITYASSNTRVATISGSNITIVGAGNTTITATQAAWASYASVTTTAALTVLSQSTPTSVMVLVQGGTLPSSSRLGVESVASFQIGKYEVTWGEWKSVRDWAVSNNKGYDLAGVGDTFPSGGADNFPVVKVSWYDVVKWSNAKSEKEGKTPVYTANGTTYKTGQFAPTLNTTANGYRLPSEKEWEWATRGGVSSKGNTYSGSNTASEVAWTNEILSNETKAVGTKAANELGIYDMGGNVFEWCEDVANTSDRRLRGGSWSDYPYYATVAHRGTYRQPGDQLINFGFRLARSSGN